MILRVQYEDDRYDYVDPRTLDKLLESKELGQFYRPSEGRWVDACTGPIRGAGGYYAGPDRRQLCATR